MKESKKKTVLIVDDDQFVRRVTARLLQNMGYQVVEEIDGQPAFERLRDLKTPDLLVTDQEMPHTGLSLVRRIRNELKLDRLPIVVVSGNFNSALKEHFHGLKAISLSKPFTSKQLEMAIYDATRMVAPLD